MRTSRSSWREDSSAPCCTQLACVAYFAEFACSAVAPESAWHPDPVVAKFENTWAAEPPWPSESPSIAKSAEFTLHLVAAVSPAVSADSGAAVVARVAWTPCFARVTFVA